MRCALATSEGSQLLDPALQTVPPWVRVEVEVLLHGGQGGDGGRDVDGWAKQRMLESVRQLLLAVGTVTSIALVIEDLHWADALTIDLIQYLLVPRVGGVIPIVVSVRAGEAATGHVTGLIGRQPHNSGVRHVTLDPLTSNETAEQIELVLHRTPDADWMAEIFARTDGNPLFTNQLVSHLARSTSAAMAPGGTVPTDLLELVRARVDEVGDIERALVQTLAVAGGPLSEEDLAALCDEPAEATRRALATLDSVALTKISPLAGDHQLAHAVLGDAVVAALSPSVRRELHRRVARRIGEHHGDAPAATIAHHYRSAQEWSAELLWRVVAARRADAVHAGVEAVEHWCRALDLMRGPAGGEGPDTAADAEVFVRAQEALWVVGRAEDASQLAEEAATRFPTGGGSPLMQAELFALRGRARAMTDAATGLDLLLRAEGLHGREASPELVRTLGHIEGQLRQAGHFDEASEYSQRALEMASALGLNREVARSLSVCAWSAMARGDGEGALAMIDQQLATIGPDYPPHARLGIAVEHTDILLKLGRLREVPAAGAVALVAAEHGLESAFTTAIVKANICEAAIQGGRPADAEEMIYRGTSDVEIGPHNHPLHAARAEFDMLKGDFAAADARWQHLHSLDIATLESRVEYALREGELRLWMGRSDLAFEIAVAALREAAATDESTICGPLLVLAMRAAADTREHPALRGHGDGQNGALLKVDTLDALRGQMRTDPFGHGSLTRTGHVDLANWDAERSRLLGESDPGRWVTASSAWTALDRPYRAAYAQWRQAEALLVRRARTAGLADLVQVAYLAAVGHTPLRSAIEGLARNARIQISSTPSASTPPSGRAESRFGLTDRERDVLLLLREGRTNAEIGHALFISPRTVGIHVSSILRKLDVRTRAHAASIAERAGLFTSS